MTSKNFKIDFLDHIVLTVTNITKAKNFYSKVFGRPKYSDKYQVMYQMGKTKLFFALPYGKLPKNDKFNPNRVGLEHLAFGVLSLRRLRKISSLLDKSGIKHSGVHVDKHSKKEKIWLNDPDGIRIEFFL